MANGENTPRGRRGGSLPPHDGLVIPDYSSALDSLKERTPDGPWYLAAGSQERRTFLPGAEQELLDWLNDRNMNRRLNIYVVTERDSIPFDPLPFTIPQPEFGETLRFLRRMFPGGPWLLSTANEQRAFYPQNNNELLSWLHDRNIEKRLVVSLVRPSQSPENQVLTLKLATAYGGTPSPRRCPLVGTVNWAAPDGADVCRIIFSNPERAYTRSEFLSAFNKTNDETN